MNEVSEPAPRLSLDDRVNIAISRVKEIQFFEYVEPIDLKWIESQIHILMDTLSLPYPPIKIFNTIKEGNEFANLVDQNDDWGIAWEKIRLEALRASGGYNNTDMSKPWHYSRRKSLDVTDKLEQEGGRMERDAAKRCASWVQYITVEDKIKKPNPLNPFVVVNEKGADLIGVANGVFGVFIPQAK